MLPLSEQTGDKTVGISLCEKEIFQSNPPADGPARFGRGQRPCGRRLGEAYDNVGFSLEIALLSFYGGPTGGTKPASSGGSDQEPGQILLANLRGTEKQPSACTRDIAGIAAKLLLDNSWSGVGSSPVLGPEDLSYNDMARIMSEALGKPVHFQQIPGDVFKARMLQNGMSEAMAQGALDMWLAYNQGLDTAEPRTPQSSTPTTFHQWCEEFLKPRVLA